MYTGDSLGAAECISDVLININEVFDMSCHTQFHVTEPSLFPICINLYFKLYY